MNTTGRKHVAKRGPKGRFLPGSSPNPSGRPRGSRNRASKLGEALFAGELEAVARKVVELAKAGDVTAARLILERLIPPARERPLDVALSLPKVAADLPAAVARVLELVAAGELLPGEGERLAGLLGAWREATELVELEARVAALEARE